MSVYSRLLVLVTVSILALACDDTPTSPGDSPIAYETVVKSSASGFFTPRREVIRNTEEWVRVWDLLHAGQNPVPPRPSIDFEQEMVALAAMGTWSNGCYRVEITAINLRGTGALEIDVEEFDPTASCVCTLAITQPVHVVRLDRIALAESFRVRREPLTC